MNNVEESYKLYIPATKPNIMHFNERLPKVLNRRIILF